MDIKDVYYWEVEQGIAKPKNYYQPERMELRRMTMEGPVYKKSKNPWFYEFEKLIPKHTYSSDLPNGEYAVEQCELITNGTKTILKLK